MGSVPDSPRSPATGRQPVAQGRTTTDGVPEAAMPERFEFDPALKPRPGEEALSREEVAYWLLNKLGAPRAANQARGVQWHPNPFKNVGFGAQELLDTTVKKQDREMLDLAWEIIDRLPEEGFYESVLKRSDLRLLIFPLMASQQQLLEGTVPDAIRVGDAVVRGQTRARLTEVFQQIDRQERQQALSVAGMDKDESVSADEKLEMVRSLTALPEDRSLLRPNMASVFAEVARADEVRESMGLTEAEALEMGLGADDFTRGTLTSSREFATKLMTSARTDMWRSEEEMRFLVAVDGHSLQQIMEWEANKVQARLELEPDDDGSEIPGDMEVNLGLDLRERLTDAQYEAYLAMSDTERPREPLRYLDAINFITHSNLSGAEIRNIQNHLVEAGYMDEPDWWGDSTDTKTISAWRRLMDDSYGSGRSFADILARRRAKNEDDKNDKEFTRNYTLTDSARIRVATDTIAQQILGRSLTDDERSAYVEAIHAYETDYANTFDKAIRDDEGVMIEDVDVNARIEEMLANDHSVESEAFGALQQFAVFDDIARSPG